MLWTAYLHEDLSEFMPQGRRLMPLARAVFGHHGRPVPDREPIDVETLYREHGLACARQFARETTGLVMPGSVAVQFAGMQRASFLLAHAMVMADWVGSHRRFLYRPEEMPLRTYWHSIALPTAREAVTAFGLVPAPCAAVRSYTQLLGREAWTPTPMQEWAQGVALPAGPALYIIEDSTGSGKTEAALMLAHRLISDGRADGLYLALPTQATANGLYRRLAVPPREGMAPVYANLFAMGGHPSLTLTHAARDLHPVFRASIFDLDETAQEGAGAQCAAWIGDNRRAGFSAQVGVGTIDQALMAVLPVTHQALRLGALAQRVLILDEVHAYDAYMAQEIVALLQAQATLGGSVILLSATLPESMRRSFAQAYAAPGAGLPEMSQDYPLVTVQLHRGIASQTRVAPRPSTVRDVPVRFVQSLEAAERTAVAAVQSGQAVLLMRNTIKDAVNSHERVSRALPEATLFHSRFVAVDRRTIEEGVLATYGDGSTRAERAGQILIATQVVEQSLDVDFDLIVTDIAPIDLLIQRAGRLWRHARREALGERPADAVRELVVLSPAPTDDAGVDWLGAELRRTGRVYANLGQLWLTARALERAGSIDAPGGLRVLIEAVYGEGRDAEVPLGLRAATERALEHERENAGLANARTLKVGAGYALTAHWESDDDATTRLGDPTTTLRLGVVRGGRLVPWAALTTKGSERELWALSEIRVPLYMACGVPEQLGEGAALVAAAHARWQPWEVKERPLLILGAGADGKWTGQSMVARGRGEARRFETVTLRYSRQSGMARAS
jgi:CRISPR-associated endonuclease/helicase Cas3